MGTIILSALVAHTGWHWMTERAERLGQYRFQWPAPTFTLLAGAMRWLMAAALLGGLSWLIFAAFRRRKLQSTHPPPASRAAE